MSEFAEEINKFRKIPLGEREEQFLSLLFSQDLGAYDILRLYRDYMNKPMGYKDIHQRMKRLESVGLIEQTGKKGKRNKILYRLTNLGLFHFFLITNVFPYPTVLNKRRNNIILKNILYRFFDPGTIKKFSTYHRLIILSDYLRKCCQSLMQNIAAYRSTTQIDPRLLFSTDRVIKEEVKDLVLKIVITRIREYHYPAHPFGDPHVQNPRLDLGDTEAQDGSNYVDLFPRPALKNDSKFMKLLKEVKNDFDDGCKYYLEG